MQYIVIMSSAKFIFEHQDVIFQRH